MAVESEAVEGRLGNYEAIAQELLALGVTGRDDSVTAGFGVLVFLLRR